MPTTQDLESKILVGYGALLDSSQLAKLLGYPSTDAVRTARKRGKLPIPMFRLPNRKGWYANSTEVANWLRTVAPREGLGSPKRMEE